MSFLHIAVQPITFVAAAGSQDFVNTVSPIGQTPKLVYFHTSRDATLDAILTHAIHNIGATDGTTQRATSFLSEGGVTVANADSGYRIDVDTCIQGTLATSQAIDNEAAFTSYSTDKATVNFGNAPNAAWHGYAVFVYGDSDIEVNVSNLATGPLVNDVATSTAAGFQGDAAIVVSVGQTFVADGSGAQGMLSVGFATRSPSAQCCLVKCVEDQVSPSSAAMETRDIYAGEQLLSVAGVVTRGAIAQFAFTSNGYTLTNKGAGACDFMVILLKTGTRRVWCGVETIAANSTGDKSVTSPGWRPGFVAALASHENNANTVNDTSSAELSFGAATPVSQAVLGTYTDDGLSGVNSVAVAIVSHSKLINVPDSTTTFDWQATMVSMDPTGFTINVGDAASGSRAVPFLAIEGGAAPGWIPATRRWRRQLGRM